jgi:glycosyltransferase involved in cell wall biosynthesis
LGCVPAFAVVIPAFNEAATIRDVVTRCLDHVAQVVVVDDGSTDGTAEQLGGLEATVLRVERNRGKAASLRLGFEHALKSGVCAAITLDGDGQHLPEDIPRLVAAYLQHPGSIVIGTRLHDRVKIPRVRYLANRLANYWVTLAAGRSYPDTQSGFRIYPAAFLRRALALNTSRRFVFESEILIDAARNGIPSAAVPIEPIYDTGMRASHFRPVLDAILIGRMIALKIFGRAKGFRRPHIDLQRQENSPQSQSASL